MGAALDRQLVEGALKQIGKTTDYDGRYQLIDYPAGDVSLEKGVCTDVIVRAFRAVGIDLQVLVHEDMKKAWQEYPKKWTSLKPDPNIDHRRVPNLQMFFKRRAKELPVSSNGDDFKPGDLVAWMLSPGVPHIGIVSDKKKNSRPWIVHNIGAGARLEDILFAYEMIGHYRWEGFQMNQTEAVMLATSFLKQQAFAGEYEATASDSKEKEDVWEVWFKRNENMRPAYGLVEVDKKTAQARWVSLQ